MKQEKIHPHYYWIRHKDGYLFCGICKKSKDELYKMPDSDLINQISKNLIRVIM